MNEGARIRRATADDRGELFDVWLRSVRATHTFVPDADIESLSPLVRDYLASSEARLWVSRDVEPTGPQTVLGRSGFGRFFAHDALIAFALAHRSGPFHRVVPLVTRVLVHAALSDAA